MSTTVSMRHRTGQRGLTLIELMVAVALNLVVVLVAAYLYLNGRSTEKSMEERAALFENGQLALELLGKEIGNAGYYPAHMQEPGTTLSVARGQYTNPVPAVPAFDAGVFGCTHGYFNVKSGACAAADDKTKTGDGIVLNYFTDDALNLSAGARADCQGHIVDKDTAANTADRVGAAANNPQLPPAHPLFVSNGYTLTQLIYKLDGGRTISTFGLSCDGNGGNTSYQSLVPGIEQLRIKYGLRDASAARATQYVDATAAGAAAPIVADDQTYQGWQRVVSVQVCLVARSLTATRFRGAGAETRLDCDGNTFPDDGVQRRRFIQVFAVKNRLS